MCIRHSLVRLKDVDTATNAPISCYSVYDGPAIPDGVDIHEITSVLVDKEEMDICHQHSKLTSSCAIYLPACIQLIRPFIGIM